MGFEISENSKISNKPVKNQGEPLFNSQNKTQMSVFEKKHPVVAEIDDFANKDIYIDPYDWTCDMTHGEAVASFIKAQCPAANIQRMGNLKPEDNLDFSITKSLKELSDSIDKGEKIDAVNMSIGIAIAIKKLAKATGLPLNRKNLHQYQNEIRNWIKNNDNKSIEKKLGLDKETNLKEILENIEKITSKGIPVYIAAGNGRFDAVGAACINLFSLANGVTTVGALEKDGKTKTNYSGDHSLVNKWEIGDNSIKRTKKDGKWGYDINGDNNPEILEENTSSNKFLSLKTPVNIVKSIFLTSPIDDNKTHGTSFSTPTALGKDLRTRFGDACRE